MYHLQQQGTTPSVLEGNLEGAYYDGHRVSLHLVAAYPTSVLGNVYRLTLRESLGRKHGEINWGFANELGGAKPRALLAHSSAASRSPWPSCTNIPDLSTRHPISVPAVSVPAVSVPAFPISVPDTRSQYQQSQYQNNRSQSPDLSTSGLSTSITDLSTRHPISVPAVSVPAFPISVPAYPVSHDRQSTGGEKAGGERRKKKEKERKKGGRSAVPGLELELDRVGRARAETVVDVQSGQWLPERVIGDTRVPLAQTLQHLCSALDY
eukprot:2011733-Rhodomonas_salina.1